MTIGFKPTSVPEREPLTPEDDSWAVPCLGTGYAGYSARGTTDDEEPEEDSCETCTSRAKWEFRLAVVRTSAAVVAVLCAVVAVAHSL